MPDWTKTMKQTFEYYKVNPDTWKDETPLNHFLDSRIDVDSAAETRASASFTSSDLIGECYIRVYLVTNQNGIVERFPLGTYMVQTPSYSFDGMIKNITMDAYSPLIELKEKMPPIGYFTPKNKNISEEVCNIIDSNMRGPLVSTYLDDVISFDFVSDTNDNWLQYATDLLSNARQYIDLDEIGRVIIKPQQSTESLRPTWVYDDGNSSILYPAMSLDNDLYGIPNSVEVIYSSDEYHFYSKVTNTDDDSPISVVNRGREIIHRITNPEITGTPTQDKINDHAERTLKELSTLEYTITYTHGYCGTRVGDAVILNYRRSGLNNVKAKIISQSISCTPGTPVEEKAIFTTKLWG